MGKLFKATIQAIAPWEVRVVIRALIEETKPSRWAMTRMTGIIPNPLMENPKIFFIFYRK
jgi:hypothetical protein